MLQNLHDRTFFVTIFTMREIDRLDKKYKSTLHYVLSGLIPYTEANVKLTFKPNWFFNDLEKLDRAKANKNAIKASYYRSVKNGLIEFDRRKNPRLTAKGQLCLELFEPKKLKHSSLMIIFDVPETEKAKRQQLRTLLRQLKFRQIQKSVWISQYESREYLESELEVYDIKKYVKLFEAEPIWQ